MEFESEVPCSSSTLPWRIDTRSPWWPTIFGSWRSESCGCSEQLQRIFLGSWIISLRSLWTDIHLPRLQRSRVDCGQTGMRPFESNPGYSFWKSRPWWPKLKAMVTDLHILIPRSTDAFRWQGKPFGLAHWHVAILHLNKIPHLLLISPRKEKMNDLLLAVERWMTNLEELSRTSGSHNLTSILNDLDETRGRYGRPQLKDLLTDQVSE